MCIYMYTSRNPFTNGLINNLVISFPFPRIYILVNHEVMKPCHQLHFYYFPVKPRALPLHFFHHYLS